MSSPHLWLDKCFSWFSWTCYRQLGTTSRSSRAGNVTKDTLWYREEASSEIDEEKQLQRCMTTSTCEPSDISGSSLDQIPNFDEYHCHHAVSELSALFSEFEWETWDTCRLRVDSELGAGIVVQATRYGYLVDAVEQIPGQDEPLQIGKLIICIGDSSLVGLQEAELETVFGVNFHEGAVLGLLEWSEVCAAEIEQEACALGEWHEDAAASSTEKTGILPLASPFLREQEGPAELLVMLTGAVPDSDHTAFLADLATLERSFGPSLQLYYHGDDTITMCGETKLIRLALKDLDVIIRQYGVDPIVEDEVFIKMISGNVCGLLVEDLHMLSQRHGIVTELCCPPNEEDSIILCGDVARLGQSITELNEILSFYGIARAGSLELRGRDACATEDTLHEAEDLEVERQMNLCS